MSESKSRQIPVPEGDERHDEMSKVRIGDRRFKSFSRVLSAANYPIVECRYSEFVFYTAEGDEPPTALYRFTLRLRHDCTFRPRLLRSFYSRVVNLEGEERAAPRHCANWCLFRSRRSNNNNPIMLAPTSHFALLSSISRPPFFNPPAVNAPRPRPLLPIIPSALGDQFPSASVCTVTYCMITPAAKLPRGIAANPFPRFCTFDLLLTPPLFP